MGVIIGSRGGFLLLRVKYKALFGVLTLVNDYVQENLKAM